MERFGLTRVDLMLMTWSQVAMLFDATYDNDDVPSRVSADSDNGRWATKEEYAAWF